jgi:hypothetical protein
MYYTAINQKWGHEINKIEKGIIEHPSWKLTQFSLEKLGIRPYRYQHILFKYFLDPYRKRVMVCKSRQIGISTAIEIMALYAAINNLYPSGIFKNTKIGIVSKSDKQSKKVLLDIKKLMAMGDSYNEDNFFSNMIDTSKFIPFNMYELNFKNKSFIKCFPPTDAVRGESLDVVFVDEGAFIDDDIFYDSIEPTTSKTNGKIFIVSTPRGQKGFFFELFDPFDKYKTHPYTRFWFYWKQCEDLIQKKLIKQKYQEAKEKGTLKNFDQEYNALFTVDEEAFFSNDDINRAIDRTIDMEYTWNQTPCSLAIDYGQTKSATSLTVKTKYKGIIRTLWQWSQVDFDENLLTDARFEHSIPNLVQRYNIKWIIVDDCPQGYRTNQQLENEGYPIKRFDFKGGEKNKAYYNYRGALKKGLIKFPEIPKLISEMKSLMEVRMKVTTSITKPKGGYDDRIDGEVMASIPFLEDEGDFETVIIEPKKTEEQKKIDFRRSFYDHEWDYLRNTLPDPSVLINNEVKE